MSQKIEKLNLLNIIEINKIREILEYEPDLLSMFELLVVMGNNRLNDEKILITQDKEHNSDSDSDIDVVIVSDSDSDDDDSLASSLSVFRQEN